jgi:hypothetical protein
MPNATYFFGWIFGWHRLQPGFSLGAVLWHGGRPLGTDLCLPSVGQLAGWSARKGIGSTAAPAKAGATQTGRIVQSSRAPLGALTEPRSKVCGIAPECLLPVAEVERGIARAAAV